MERRARAAASGRSPAAFGGNGNNPLSLVWESPENREIGFPKAQFEYCGGQPAATTLYFDPKDSSVLVRFFDPETEAVRFEKKLSTSEV